MLTAPKLTSPPIHKRQLTLDNIRTLSQNLSVPNFANLNQTNRHAWPNTTQDLCQKNKQNIPKAKKLSLHDGLDYGLMNNSLKTIPTRKDAGCNGKFLPQNQKKYDRHQFNISQTNMDSNTFGFECFSPKYRKDRQNNQKLLQSLKLENQKYKKLISENQYLKQKKYSQKFDISEFSFLSGSELNKHNLSAISRDQKQKLTIPAPRKALDDMTYMTNSIVFQKQKSYAFERLSTANTSNRSSQSLFQMTKWDFEKIKFLGKGNFGEVNLVRHKKTNFICAMKTIKKSFVKQENVVHQISRQIRIHLSLKHLNIISFYGFFDDHENVYLLTEYATGGQLYKKLKDCYRMPEQQVAPIIRNALEGLKMIHSLGYIHRDLKPENMIFQFGLAKICDLGWAADCGFNEMRKSYCGTPLYLPPEMIRKENYDQSADIWSIGILTYQLIVGKIPFNIWSEYDLQQIVDREIVFPTSYVDMSAECIDFMKQCLQKNPYMRVKLEKLLNHPFLSEKSLKNGYFNCEVYDTVERLFE